VPIVLKKKMIILKSYFDLNFKYRPFGFKLKFKVTSYYFGAKLKVILNYFKY
jgi:hypothetical protein